MSQNSLVFIHLNVFDLWQLTARWLDPADGPDRILHQSTCSRLPSQLQVLPGVHGGASFFYPEELELGPRLFLCCLELRHQIPQGRNQPPHRLTGSAVGRQELRAEDGNGPVAKNGSKFFRYQRVTGKAFGNQFFDMGRDNFVRVKEDLFQPAELFFGIQYEGLGFPSVSRRIISDLFPKTRTDGVQVLSVCGGL